MTVSKGGNGFLGSLGQLVCDDGNWEVVLGGTDVDGSDDVHDPPVDVGVVWYCWLVVGKGAVCCGEVRPAGGMELWVLVFEGAGEFDAGD